MSGFLRRLSAQALGTGETVRPAVRHRYATAPVHEDAAGQEVLARRTIERVEDERAPSADRSQRDALDRGWRSEPRVLVEPSRVSAPVTTSPPDVADEPTRAPMSLPSPLLPTAPRGFEAPALAARIAAQPSAASRHESIDDDTNEVHVTIGRIEVTAVHEAPPPSRRETSRQPTLSLEQYLTTRRGEC